MNSRRGRPRPARLLDRIIDGTEPDAGSDTGGFKTRATQLGNGQWSVGGEKAYITNAGTPLSAFTLILAVSSPKDAERKKFTLFLTPNDAPGYTRGEPYSKMGWKSSDTRPLFLSDVQLGPDVLARARKAKSVPSERLVSTCILYGIWLRVPMRVSYRHPFVRNGRILH